MTNEVLFLAAYPTVENSKDGMISRIRDIDELFIDVPRTYIQLSLKRNVKTHLKIGLVDVVELNAILHFWRILKIISSHKYIYTHSVYNLRLFWFFLMFFKKDKQIILDVHGIVPEEIKYFYKEKISYLYFSFVEKYIFKKIKYAVFVTNAMHDHYESKYQKLSLRYTPLIYYIIPNKLKDVSLASYDFNKKSKFVTNILYSGGVQPWQNIDLMLDTIKLNQNENLKYHIFTPDVDIIKAKVKTRNINDHLISVESREPEELWKEYLLADYAFILRDDNLINKVACPTKLTEYLYYGIIPIVLSPNIGDFNMLGYQYIPLSDFNDRNFDKPTQLNQNNIAVVKKMIEFNKENNIRNKIFSI